jgi:hypothetical protein
VECAASLLLPTRLLLLLLLSKFREWFAVYQRRKQQR